MSQNESVMYPADYDQDVPTQAELVRRLLEGGFLVMSQSPHHLYDLSTSFMTSSELSLYDEAIARGSSWPGQRVQVVTYEAPEIFASSQIQYVEMITAPDGMPFGEPDRVEEYLQALYEDAEAVAIDPVSGQAYPISALDFDETVGFGKAMISISGFRSADDCRLDVVGQIVGFPLKYCYLAG